MTQNRQLPPELLSIYVPQIVNQLINERMMAYEADRLGLVVSPEETDTAIVDTLPAQLVKDGKVDGATLNAMLQQQGMTLAGLKDSTSRSLLVNRLEQIVVNGVVVSPAEIEKEYRPASRRKPSRPTPNCTATTTRTSRISRFPRSAATRSSCSTRP